MGAFASSSSRCEHQWAFGVLAVMATPIDNWQMTQANSVCKGYMVRCLSHDKLMYQSSQIHILIARR